MATTKALVTVDSITSIGEGFVTTSSGKNWTTLCPLKVGDQVITIINGAKLSKIDPRLVAIKEFLNIDEEVNAPKIDKIKISGVCFDINRFIEISAAIAFKRMDWLALDSKDRKPFEEYIAGEDFSSVLNVN